MRLVAVALTAATLACGSPENGAPETPRQPSPEPPAPAAATASPDEPDLDLAPLLARSRDWVDLYLPRDAASGYTLTLYRRRVPVLLDMNGGVVHAWPEVRAYARARLLPSGHLLMITPDNAVEEVDWLGERTWRWRPERPTDLLHHDVIRLAGGDVLVLVRDEETGCDLLVQVDRAGETVWRWDSRPHLHRFSEAATAPPNDVTHFNSVQELPENRWHDAGDERFRPGNLLISARNLNAVFVLDRDSGEPVWIHEEGLDHQHEALMIEPGLPGAGNVLLFDNGLANRDEYRRSAILEISPPEGEVVWRYASPHFFSSTGGTEQPLPRGNVLITSSQGGRLFEVDRAGRIVWQWAPDYKPIRARRYPYDHTPQLAALTRPEERRVTARDPELFIDQDLYAFTVPQELPERRVAGRLRRLLPSRGGCSRLLLPEGAVLHLGAGPDPDAAPGTGTGGAPNADEVARRQWRGTLRVSLRPAGEENLRPVDEIALSGPRPWREVRVDLAEWGRREVELCVELETHTGTGTETGSGTPLLLEDPRILSGRLRHVRADLRELSEEELAARRRQLEALGYVD